MEKGITIKKWEMDYSFLIKNYLNPEMWEKTWTLFQYKNFVITLNIYCIYTAQESISFDVRCHYVTEYGVKDYIEETISISLKIEDVTFMKRQINTAILNCITKLEIQRYICKTEEYENLQTKREDERETLEGIAEEFLDKCNITNDTLREAYTDAYVDEYAKFPAMINDYVSSRMYRELTDFYLIWLDTLEDDPKKEIRTREIKERLGDEAYDEIMQEIKEYEEYMETKDFKEEMENNLEEIIDE